MPIIPLKEFTIQDGSYVQWSGNPMDPMLNLTATERMRASVTQDDGSSRLVTFNVGVAIKQTLENLQLQFILSAPEDWTRWAKDNARRSPLRCLSQGCTST